jgi:hypothetical protein
MTTFKYFTIEKLTGTRSEFQISLSIFLLTLLSYSNIYSQSTTALVQKKFTNQQHSEKGSDNVLLMSEISAPLISAENEDEETRIEINQAMDQERTDGIDMFFNGTQYHGSSKINFEIEFLQEGYSVVQVLDASSGEFLINIMNAHTKVGKQSFDIDHNDFKVNSIIVVATHTTIAGQTIESSLRFELFRTEDIPLSSGESVENLLIAQLTPTAGRGLFQIRADFKTKGSANVRIFDMNGRLVETLFSGKIQEGAVTFEGDSSNWLAGNYIVCIETEKGRWTQKMIVR